MSRAAITAIAVLMGGCATPMAWRGEPSPATASNEHYSAEVVPVCTDGRMGEAGGCTGFILKVTNKTAKDIEINWNKTAYIRGGQTSGGFMFDGVVYRDRAAPKPPDVVFANGSMEKAIWPNNLIDFLGSRSGGWHHWPMPEGENGVYLSVVADGKEINQKITVRITSSPKK